MIDIRFDNRSLFGQRPKYLVLQDIKDKLDIMRRKCIEKYGFDAEYRYYGLSIDAYSFLLGILSTCEFGGVVAATIELLNTQIILKINDSKIAEIDVIPEQHLPLKVEVTYDSKTISELKDAVNKVKE